MTFIELLDKHPMAAAIALGVAFVGARLALRISEASRELQVKPPKSEDYNG